MTKIEDTAKLVEQKSPNDVVIIHSVNIKCLLTHGVIQYSHCYHFMVAGQEQQIKGKKYTFHGKACSCLPSFCFSNNFFFFFLAHCWQEVRSYNA